MDLETLKTWRKWDDHPENPLINPEPPEWIIADPTFIPASDSPDGRWHLFAHGPLSGIYHFISKDGIKWKNIRRNIPSAIRPFLFKEDDMYFLLYEKLFTPLFSNIAFSMSANLLDWTEPKVILTPNIHWEGLINRRVGNPCLVKYNNKYRLYYSAGSVFFWDAMVPEPKHIGFAEAKQIEGPYKKYTKPIISPSNKHRWRTKAAGALKVLHFDDFWVGFNNGFFEDQHGQTRSTILLLYSTNGVEWHDVFKNPIIYPTEGWKSSFVYQLDVKKIEDTYWIYYNAREGWVRGVERIGLAILQI